MSFAAGDEIADNVEPDHDEPDHIEIKEALLVSKHSDI